jgi:hypothetical protein
MSAALGVTFMKAGRKSPPRKAALSRPEAGKFNSFYTK